jgi:hypothetical protein
MVMGEDGRRILDPGGERARGVRGGRGDRCRRFMPSDRSARRWRQRGLGGPGLQCTRGVLCVRGIIRLGTRLPAAPTTCPVRSRIGSGGLLRGRATLARDRLLVRAGRTAASTGTRGRDQRSPQLLRHFRDRLGPWGTATTAMPPSCRRRRRRGGRISRCLLGRRGLLGRWAGGTGLVARDRDRPLSSGSPARLRTGRCSLIWRWIARARAHGKRECPCQRRRGVYRDLHQGPAGRQGGTALTDGPWTRPTSRPHATARDPARCGRR